MDEKTKAELLPRALEMVGAFGEEIDMKTTGGLLAKSLKSLGVDAAFYLFGGPMNHVEKCMEILGVRMIDVRHEQAAAMAAHAYSRVTGEPGVCMAGMGADVLNLVTGISNALMDCSPVVALCGSVFLDQLGTGAFQEVDQLGVMKPVTKGAWAVHHPDRITDFVGMAFRHAVSNKPGPVYLEFPGDVLYAPADGDMDVPSPIVRQRPMGDKSLVKKAINLLSASERPVVFAGSGVLWSKASAQMKEFVEISGIPFYTTPLARGVIPEDHPLYFPGARSVAFREADCVLVIGTRANFIVGHFQAPRFAAAAKFIEVNIDAAEIGNNRRVELGIVGDAGAVLQQFIAEARQGFVNEQIADWIDRLRDMDIKRAEKESPMLYSDATPIHPLRLCRELRDFMPRDAILVVDGHEILSFARQSIPTYYPGHRLNIGPSGCVGVGVPFGIGAKTARPDKSVFVLSGDGSFGFNGMEMDTAIRHGLSMVVVISNNGGHSNALTSDWVCGRDLAFTRYDKIVEAMGGHGEFVEQPGEIRPALERAFHSGKPALVNVMTDPYAMALTQKFGGEVPWDK